MPGDDRLQPTATATWSGETARQDAGRPDLGPRFEVSRQLGRGGQATVWLARDREVSQWVAVKVFPVGMAVAARERLRREVRLGRSLQHERLVRLYELVDAGESPALVSEWLQGGSVADRMARGALPLEEVLRVADQCLEGLAYVHGQGVVHRDVKPSNLLLDERGEVKLGDLGLARLVEPGDTVTRTAAALGTPRYMSPEQVRGLPTTPASDLYALGATLFELLTGEALFPSTEGFDSAIAHLSERPRNPRSLRRECPSWLAGFVLRLLEKRPGDRYADGSAALRAFRRQRVAASPRVWRRLALALAGGGALAVAVAALWPAARVPATATVAGNTVSVQDARGRKLWQRELAAPPLPLVADLLGDERPEVVVGTPADGQQWGSPAPQLLVFDGDGREVAQGELGLRDLRAYHPRLESAAWVTGLVAVGGGRGRRADLAWSATHAWMSPCEVGVWSLDNGTPPQALLVNSGHLHHLVGRDLDGDGVEELIAWGINNPIGYQLVVAVIRLRTLTGGHFAEPAPSPDLGQAWLVAACSSPEALPIAYTPLGPYNGRLELTRADPGGQVLEGSGVRLELDRHGNPVASPLFGEGTAARQRFWTDLAQVSGELETGGDPDRALSGFLARQTGALSEPPSRLAADLLLARSLARAGRHREAADLLREATSRDREVPDLWLRLGEQELMAGDPGRAADALREGSVDRHAGRDPGEAILDLGLVAILTGDRRLLDEALARWATHSAPGRPTGIGADLLGFAAFAAADWGSTWLAGSGVVPNAPSLEVARVWAADERGGPRRDLEPLLSSPETRPCARLLEANRALSDGSPGRAASLVREAVVALEWDARTSLEARLWLGVAEHLAGRAAEAQGDRPAAREHARRAAAIAPGCWFGGYRPSPAAGSP